MTEIPRLNRAICALGIGMLAFFSLSPARMDRAVLTLSIGKGSPSRSSDFVAQKTLHGRLIPAPVLNDTSRLTTRRLAPGV